MNSRQLIATRIGRFFTSGQLVNLGIGLPTQVANYLPDGVEILLHGENGIIGLGPDPAPGEEDVDIFNAGALPSTIVAGGAVVDTATSFALIRGGHVAATVLGALEVDQEGSLANWIVPHVMVPGMGGAMDLVAGCPLVIVAMEHCTKKGAPKILKQCTLPLTAYRKVSYVVTELCVLQCTADGLVLLETAPGISIDEVVKKTEADLIIPAEVGYMMYD